MSKLPSIFNDEFYVSCSAAEDLDAMWQLYGASRGWNAHEHNKLDLEDQPPLESLRLYSIAFRHCLDPINRDEDGSIFRYRLVEKYANAGLLRLALDYLTKVLISAEKQPGADTWIHVMEAARKFRQPHMASRIFSQMQELGVRPPKRLLHLLMHTYAENYRPNDALNVIECMRQIGMQIDHYSYAAAMKACIRSKDIATANAILQKMQTENVKVTHKVWNALMMTYAASGDPSGAEHVFSEMIKHGNSASTRDFTALLRAYREAEDVDGGLSVVESGRLDGIKPDVSLLTELMRLESMKGGTVW